MRGQFLTDIIKTVYRVFMARVAVSLTIAEENLTWLKGHAVRAGGSLSAVLNELISRARAGGLPAPPHPRSVVGTIDLTAADPMLEGADEAVRALFHASLQRPMVVREVPPQYGTRGPRRKPRRG
jgi:hypothetical protein